VKRGKDMKEKEDTKSYCKIDLVITTKEYLLPILPFLFL